MIPNFLSEWSGGAKGITGRLAFWSVGLVGVAIPVTKTLAQALPRATFDHSDTLTANEGYVALKWGGDSDALVYEVQSALEPLFHDPTTEYQGRDEQSFLSGLASDHYYFRVRARMSDGPTWGPWSSPVEIICKHHSLTVAWALFASGGLLFLLIVAFVGIHARSMACFEGSHA